MGFQFVKFLLTTIIIKQVGNFPLGCLYNDTVYREEQTVKTNEPCLSCVCRKGSLMCNLVVCIDPPDTPPGCFVVHQANECCPQIFCQDTYIENMVEVRTAFQSKNKTKRNDCFVNESIYAEGSAVPTSQLCEYCYCIGGEIKCIKPHCILAFEGCKSVYQKSSCCPTYYDCRDVSIDILQSLKKSAVNSNSKILTKSFRSILNETIAKNILKLPKDLITSSKMSKFLGQTEDKLIWTTLKKLKLIPEKGMNGKDEHLEKETEKLENSTSSGIFFPVISNNTANNNIGSANPKKQEQNGLIGIDSHAVKNEDKYQPKKIPIFDTTSEENFNFKHNPVFRPPIKRVQKFIFRPNFKKDSNSSIVLNNKELVVTSGVNFNSDLNMTFSALDNTRPVSVASLIKDLTQFHAIHRQSVKPLTVIYKNIIVDYYPEYFVTSARDSAEMKTVNENHRKSLTVHNFSSVSKSDLSILTNFMGQNLSRLCESIHSETIENDSFSHSFSCITNIQKKSTPLTNKTLIDTTTDGSLKNFLEENIKSTTMRSLRHKYSSKTKIQTMPTAEFARRNVLEQSTIQPRTHNKTLISIEKEEKKVYRNLIAPLEEHKNITTLELRRGFDYGKEADIQMKKLEDNSSHSNRKSESATQIKPNLGNYLKLAGCNIYGRMYRIGKIIPELSGPCLECLCTDLGVQCSSLHC